MGILLIPWGKDIYLALKDMFFPLKKNFVKIFGNFLMMMMYNQKKSRQQQDYQTSFSDLNLNFGHDQYSKKPAKLNESVQHCDHFKQKDIQLPLEENYMSQIFSQIGAELS